MNSGRIRAHKAIAAAGLASLREAERLIRTGQVRINGEVVRKPGASVSPEDDTLEVSGARVPLGSHQPREVWALYKPRRCVSTLRDPEGRSTLRDYFPRTGARLFPVGRLDYDAEGLILLTNDGALAQQVTHPSYEVKKVYLVKVKGHVQPEALRKLAQGPVIGGRKRNSTRVRVLHNIHDKTWLEVTLNEGIQHHIKKMFLGVGHRVLKIKRYQIGTVTLDDLAPGECRRLMDPEIWSLLKPGSRTRRAPTPEPSK